MKSKESGLAGIWIGCAEWLGFEFNNNKKMEDKKSNWVGFKTDISVRRSKHGRQWDDWKCRK